MELTQARVRELFDYRDDGCLIWRESHGSRAIAGRLAGSARKDGYRPIRIDGTRHYAHRLIYLWHHGTMPAVVDHRDGNPSNNTIANLRDATMRLNQGNRRRGKRGDLPKGVDWKPRIGKWQSRITVNGRFLYLGTFDSPEAAHAAYMEAARKHFGEFARAA